MYKSVPPVNELALARLEPSFELGGQPEVDDHRLVAVGEDHVLGLDVAVDDALAVQERQRRAQASQDAQQRQGLFAEWQGRAEVGDARAQRHAGQQLHRVPGAPALDAVVENSRDPGMAQPGQRADLAAEALQAPFVAHLHGLDRGQLSRLRVLRPIDDAHAALAQGLEHPIGADGEREGHARAIISRACHTMSVMRACPDGRR